MKRKRKLLILALSLVLVSGAALLVRFLSPEEETGETAETVFAQSSDEVTELSFTYEGETLRFQKENDTWTYPDDSHFPVNASSIETMLASLEKVESSKTIENVLDLSEYGLDAPVCTVTVTAGHTSILSFGNETSLGGEQYLSIGDGNVYLVGTDLMSAFTSDLYDLVQMEEIPSITQALDLSLQTESGSVHLTYQEDSGLAYSDEYVWFWEEQGSYTALDTELTEDLMDQITMLTWLSCADYYAEEDELAQYGLDTPACVATIQYKDSDTSEDLLSFTIELGQYSDGNCFARIAGSSMVYTIDGAIADALLYTERDNLLPDEVLLVDWNEVSAVNITLGDASYRLEQEIEVTTDDEGTQTKTPVWLYEGEQIEADSLFDALDALSVSGREETAEAREQRIRFVLERSEAEDIELIFYAYTSSDDLVSLNGETGVLVSDASITALMENVTEMFTE